MIEQQIKNLELLDTKIAAKEKEVKALKNKRDALQTKIIKTLMTENKVKINDLISYFDSLSSDEHSKAQFSASDGINTAGNETETVEVSDVDEVTEVNDTEE